jgi:hypothetical protein
LILLVGNAVVDDKSGYTVQGFARLLEIIQALANYLLKVFNLGAHINEMEWNRLFWRGGFQELAHGEVAGWQRVSHPSALTTCLTAERAEQTVRTLRPLSRSLPKSHCSKQNRVLISAMKRSSAHKIFNSIATLRRPRADASKYF